MKISVKKLIELISEAEYLTKVQKNEWLGAIQYLNKEEITELAYIIASAEIEKRNYQTEQDMVNGLLAQIFVELNKKIKKKIKMKK